MNFKTFLESEYNKEVKETLQKVPKKHQALVKGYKYKFQPGNTLKNDGEHIGFVDEENKVITIAAPWNYGREYTFLHEMGHLVWKYFMDKGLKKKWQKVLKNTKEEKQNQGDEELFCMAYANHFAKNKISIHSHDEWDKFIKSII